MTRQENIDYILLRAQECGYHDAILQQVQNSLERMDEKSYAHLKRISEPVFRDWCKKLKHEELET